MGLHSTSTELSSYENKSCEVYRRLTKICLQVNYLDSFSCWTEGNWVLLPTTWELLKINYTSMILFKCREFFYLWPKTMTPSTIKHGFKVVYYPQFIMSGTNTLGVL